VERLPTESGTVFLPTHSPTGCGLDRENLHSLCMGSQYTRENREPVNLKLSSVMFPYTARAADNQSCSRKQFGMHFPG